MTSLPSWTTVPRPVGVRMPPRPAPFERSLRHQIHLEVAVVHLLDGSFAAADVGGIDLFNLMVFNQLAPTFTIKDRVIADNGQILDATLCQSIDNLFGGARSQETSDHNRGAVLNHSDSFFQRDVLFHIVRNCCMS